MKINTKNKHIVPFSEVKVGDVFKGNVMFLPEKEESKSEAYYLKLSEFTDEYKRRYNCLELTTCQFTDFLDSQKVIKVDAELTIL